ncbi:asparagine synthase (glutamine-hydrolyzing) [Alkalilimnicola sp. S0819]|uniref:asparagine synthase (glutamine-hydrolyzing) n=1 Tax=Alkalilimnicola sp. S0819 TaxID=2613922 RepID=UPI001262823E|nr:asparagine synthase (glutamine-hydrolyzing) [Alkalilimnicola sp. S0819]KAB7627753.1 asparagine synthase (glutamine-hydrolyzing) [Alkalilimnicola sp. S0819]MPQ15376.1 asparagine synthase (glutamine-hydrolyzing) [Alkalilimnicola sp. S0819]
MCGIAGLLNPALPPDALPETILGMLAAIAHRGPDGTGYFVDDRCALGTTRLAIIDPQAGIQPMCDADERYWLVYNGEIYNYRELRHQLEALGARFRTESDTEVVLQAWIHWGADCLPRFNGGFAFALYDRHRDRLVLARDRYGKRPLFYCRHGDAFLFASEMKAFAAVPGFRFEQDPAQLGSILAQWTPLPDQSGFHGIHNLPMGEWLSVAGGEISHHRYATLGFEADACPDNETQALEAIRESLRESVAMRLRSDVEVGVYLSGGVDSAIVALLAGEHASRPLSTFSVEFEDRSFDESAEQRELAAFLGTRHHPLRIRDQDIAEACPQAVYHAEMPAFRSAFIPMYLLSQKTQQAGIKVVLSGEGADEAFLGYDLFKETLLRRDWNTLDEDLRRQQLGRLYPHLEHYGPQDLAAVTGLYHQFSEEQRPGLFSHELRFQNGQFSSRLLRERADPLGAISKLVAAEPAYAGMSAVQKAQWLEYKTLLAGYLLSTQGERMSLAHGVENRCPFLDRAVIEAASSINLRFDDGFEEKRLLREAYTGRLPESVLRKRKFPYRAPDGAAFAATRPEYLELLLSEGELAKLPFLDGKFARRLSLKVLEKPAEQISTKENQTFMFLLSIVLLHHYFVAEGGRELWQSAAPGPLMRVADLRGR